ncbi:cation diffusion facilitator family transporter [Albibacterium profundi]|uniref:Cation diffusion facilitator family transporter n=1 Tax=Albibacterium profundi TaxID=3134906 RepID=A0ABV5CA17_9SPHI
MKSQKSLILLSLITAISLMVIKFIAYFITHSNAVFTDALESIVNVIASSFAFYSIYLSSLPKDMNHPYGHGKVEFFSVFIEGALIFLAALFIIGKAIYNFFFPIELTNLLEGVGLVAFTALINFLLGRYLLVKSKKLNSLTLMADGKHLLTDALSTVGLVVGLLLVYFTGLIIIDIILSLILGVFILYQGYKLLRQSVGGLMDESDVQLVKDVVDVLQQHRKDPWIDIHNLRLQRYGANLHLDCHVTLPNYFDLNKVHEEVSEIDKLINEKVGLKTEFFIHADPCLPQCCHYCNVKNCPIRSSEKTIDMIWDVELVTRNLKHFEKEKSN